jgi:hypothetical protein
MEQVADYSGSDYPVTPASKTADANKELDNKGNNA